MFLALRELLNGAKQPRESSELALESLAERGFPSVSRAGA